MRLRACFLRSFSSARAPACPYTNVASTHACCSLQQTNFIRRICQALHACSNIPQGEQAVALAYLIAEEANLRGKGWGCSTAERSPQRATSSVWTGERWVHLSALRLRIVYCVRRKPGGARAWTRGMHEHEHTDRAWLDHIRPRDRCTGRPEAW